jgi:hypothetical protein
MITHGVVIGYDRQHGARGDRYCPKVKYSTESGREIVFVDSVCGGGQEAYQAHTLVPIMYDPAEPGHALIQKFSGTWFLPVFLTALGIVSLLVFLKTHHTIRGRGGRFRSPREIRS